MREGGYFTPNILFFVFISDETSIDIKLYKFPPFNILFHFHDGEPVGTCSRRGILIPWCVKENMELRRRRMRTDVKEESGRRQGDNLLRRCFPGERRTELYGLSLEVAHSDLC